MCNSRLAICCGRKKKAWLCSLIALVIIIIIISLIKDFREPENFSMIVLAYFFSVIIIMTCAQGKCSSNRWPQDAEPNDDPPNYDDVITKASVTGKPPAPSLCQGNIDSTLSTTSNFTDSELPSYNEALNRSFETKILLEDSSYASVHK